MDDQQRRAEQLLEERMKSRKPNGATATEPESETTESTDDPTGYKADLQRMAADFANYRKRNEAERAEFAKFAKSDLIARLLDVLDGYDRALATIPDELKGTAWVEGMWLIERKLRQIAA